MPGKIIQCLKKTKTENPLVLIDEVSVSTPTHPLSRVQGALTHTHRRCRMTVEATHHQWGKPKLSHEGLVCLLPEEHY